MPTVNLVPLGLGELLDRTFSTFRKHFWLFAGIMVLPQAINIGIGIIVQVYLSTLVVPQNPQNPQAAAQAAAHAMRVGLVSLGSLIPHYILYALALGATTYAFSEVYLGRTITIRESYRVIGRRFGRLLNVIFSILLRSFGLMILVSFLFIFMVGAVASLVRLMPWVAIIMALVALLGFIASAVLVVYFLVRYSVAVPALVIERLSARRALRRSVALTKGFVWRLLLVAVLMTLISMTLVFLFQAPFSVAAVMISVKGGQPGLWLTIPSLLIGGAVGIATAPLLMISFSIAYFDLRVRKEGFDLQLMMANLDATTPQDSTGQGQINETDRLEEAGVVGVIVWTLLTAGIYQPIWFMTRRRALNNLNSSTKIGMGGPIIALVLFMASACLPFVGSLKWGSWVETENALGPVHPLILLAAGIIILLECFKVRHILLDHLAPRKDVMFSATISSQYDDLLSRVGTFFLGIFYLQYKINGMVDWFAPDKGRQEEMASPASPESPFSPVSM